MSDYTPMTDDAKVYYVTGRTQMRRQATGVQAQSAKQPEEEFDRWLAQVQTEAYDEGRLDQWDDCDRFEEYRAGKITAEQLLMSLRARNPYRKEVES